MDHIRADRWTRFPRTARSILKAKKPRAMPILQRGKSFSPHESHKTMRILWVEDNFIELEDLIRSLRRQGAKSRAVPTADEGIHEFRNTGPYDLVVVDLMLPHSLEYGPQADVDSDGPYLGMKSLRKIREVDQRIPVLVITAVLDECVRGGDPLIGGRSIAQRNAPTRRGLHEDQVNGERKDRPRQLTIG